MCRSRAAAASVVVVFVDRAVVYRGRDVSGCDSTAILSRDRRRLLDGQCRLQARSRASSTGFDSHRCPNGVCCFVSSHNLQKSLTSVIVSPRLRVRVKRHCVSIPLSLKAVPSFSSSGHHVSEGQGYCVKNSSHNKQ